MFAERDFASCAGTDGREVGVRRAKQAKTAKAEVGFMHAKNMLSQRMVRLKTNSLACHLLADLAAAKGCSPLDIVSGLSKRIRQRAGGLTFAAAHEEAVQDCIPAQQNSCSRS